MANYTKIVDYAAKDALNTGDPVKLVKGTELGAEYDAIAVAIATKANTASPAFTGVSSFAVGAVGAPSIYMTGYTTTGWYNIGANNWGFAVSGAKVLDISSTGLAVTGTLSATSALTLSGTGQLLIATAASADDKYVTISNTNGTLEYGVLAGGEGFIGTSTADNLNLQVNGSVVGNLSSTGLAVTGTGTFTGAGSFRASATSAQLNIGRTGSLVGDGWIGADSANAFFCLNQAATARALQVTQTAADGTAVISATGLAVTGEISATGATTSSGGFVGSSTTSVAVNGTGSSLMMGYIGSAITSTTDAFVSWMPDTHALNPVAINGSLLVAARNAAGAEVVLAAENAVRARVSSTGLAVTGAISATTNTNNLYEAVTLTNSSNTSAGMQILTKNGYGNLVSIDMQQVDNGTGADDGVMNIKIATNSTLSTVASISSTGLAVTGAISATTTIKTGGYTVATLPAGTVGMRAYVTDATAPTYNGALTGGGAVTVPVFYNGSAWVSA